MKKTAVAALLLGTFVPLGPAASAVAPAARTTYAVEGPARGPLCALDALAPSTDGGTATITAGPIALVDDADPAAEHTGHVTCTVQLGGDRHNDADTFAVTGPDTARVIGLTARASFTTAPDVRLCTEVVIDGATLYWDDDGTETGLDSHWSAGADARCGPAFGGSADQTYGAARALADGMPPVTVACNDGKDNDDDGLADYPADPGCTDELDPSEKPAPIQCNDGEDNDGDGLVDRDDPGCLDALDPSEQPVPRTSLACSDGVDNDGDGLVDFPQDTDCATPLGISEDPSGCATRLGLTACASYRPASLVYRATAYLPLTNWIWILGYVDTYEFTLPTGAPVRVACVVLTKGGVTTNPCGEQGGRFVSRDATLVETHAGETSRSLTAPLASVAVCFAKLVVSVEGNSVSASPGYTLC
ncbi:MAG: endoglucanase [Frankiaceae bacterium]|jgi:hypothetical protein|nr:endoglucanase [Frankiaceae bacterium]